MTRLSRSLQLICEEPFRIFFPAGLFFGILGVSLWLLFYFGVITTYPGISHARLMVQMFMGLFILGFLGTAGPRILAAPPLSLRALAFIFTVELLGGGFHIANATRAGDLCFVMSFVVFVGAGVQRFRKRKDSPPPNFTLVALGLLTGIAGAILVTFFEDEQFSAAYRFGSNLLNQGLLLLLILGISPFFLRRLLGSPQDDSSESRSLPAGWFPQAGVALGTGSLVIASFLLDIFNFPKLAGWMRVAVCSVYLIARLPFRGSNFLGNCLRFGIVSILAGLMIVAIMPNYRLAAWHVIFITGFSFMVFTVATRVIFGHSGNAALIRKRMPFFLVTAVLLFIAMLSRVTADFTLQARDIHLVVAAILWLVASLIWMAKVIPKVSATEMDR